MTINQKPYSMHLLHYPLLHTIITFLVILYVVFHKMFVFFLSALSLVIASLFASILFYKVLLCNILETSQKNYPVNTAASHHFLPLRHFLRERCLHFEPKNFMLMMHICPKLVRGSMIGSMRNSVACE